MGSARREEILTSAERARWDAVLARIGQFDFCHLAAYSQLAQLSGQGEARLLVVQEGEHIVALPVLLREVEPSGWDASLGGGQDVTSVYGYAGPVATSTHLPESLRRRFHAFVTDYFREQRVVSAFARLHPLLTQAPLLEGLGEVVPVGVTLAVDLTTPEEAQVAGYRRNHRQDLRKLVSLGVQCEEVGAERLDDFIRMYYDTMDHVGAGPDYYYDRTYFEHLLRELPGVTHLFMCFQDGEPIAGGLFTTCCGFVQWYLSGSRHDYPGPPPAKLLFDVARRWAMARGGRLLHLGGGVGGRRDSLYHFKRGFTHDEHVYSTWRFIADEAAYRELTRAAREQAQADPSEDFFPAYRHPRLRAAVGAVAAGVPVQG